MVDQSQAFTETKPNVYQSNLNGALAEMVFLILFSEYKCDNKLPKEAKAESGSCIPKKRTKGHFPKN